MLAKSVFGTGMDGPWPPLRFLVQPKAVCLVGKFLVHCRVSGVAESGDLEAQLMWSGIHRDVRRNNHSGQSHAAMLHVVGLTVKICDSDTISNPGRNLVCLALRTNFFINLHYITCNTVITVSLVGAR